MKKILLLLLFFIPLPLLTAHAAYHHGGDTDSEIVLEAYPAIKGTKLDSCALCHTGGQYEKRPGKFVSLGSCQWCHLTYGYDESGDIKETLNQYGEDYLREGKNADSLQTIASLDSDNDGFTNIEEIQALRYPGNGDDDPTKVAAPFKVLTLAELEKMDYHTQVMLMNTHKSGDFYAEYGGVPISSLLKSIGILDSASGITVFAPDGWAQYHPLEPDDDPLMYHVLGNYPQAEFFYHPTADEKCSDFGWCDYSSPSLMDFNHGDQIEVEDGLKMLLAYIRDGHYLESGVLDADNKLNGEGPFRVVPPQKIPGPPDQSVKSNKQDVIWPFDESADHNAGFATRSATIIKVEPLPEGITDIDTLEAGWSYVDEGKILIYGAIDPKETIIAKLRDLRKSICPLKRDDFKRPGHKRKLTRLVSRALYTLWKGKNHQTTRILEKLSWRVDGCIDGGEPDGNDWLVQCEQQIPFYWTIHEARALLEIE